MARIFPLSSSSTRYVRTYFSACASAASFATPYFFASEPASHFSGWRACSASSCTRLSAEIPLGNSSPVAPGCGTVLGCGTAGLVPPVAWLVARIVDLFSMSVNARLRSISGVAGALAPPAGERGGTMGEGGNADGTERATKDRSGTARLQRPPIGRDAPRQGVPPSETRIESAAQNDAKSYRYRAASTTRATWDGALSPTHETRGASREVHVRRLSNEPRGRTVEHTNTNRPHAHGAVGEGCNTRAWGDATQFIGVAATSSARKQQPSAADDKGPWRD